MGTTVSNQDLWEKILGCRDDYDNRNYSLMIKWVKSHSNVHGNEAHKLAVAGANDDSPYGGGRGKEDPFGEYLDYD